MATANKKQAKIKTEKKQKVKKTTEKKSATTKSVKKTAAKTDKKVVENEPNITEIQPEPTSKIPVKRRIVVNYNQIDPKLIELLNEKYPSGWRDYILKVEKGNGDFFHAIMLDTPDVSYLIKVSVKVDSDITDDIEKDLFGLGHDDDFLVDDDNDDDYGDKDDGIA
ncbi:MAG: hypothetical protein LBP63_11165 [Prevotellaceae bacterium]|jgi:hypothetical protein|nr:hypothetical protein [Prevotellaceae bacterium]